MQFPWEKKPQKLEKVRLKNSKPFPFKKSFCTKLRTNPSKHVQIL